MKTIEVNEDNFEALLAYDDLFLDYFNAFLSLPAFPQPIYYNRLTGTFQEVEDDQTLLGSVEEGSPHFSRALFAPTDDERERIFDWVRKQRLSLFLRTKLFLEYKLCKLLIRPLDEKLSGSRLSSRNIRGYSRTTSYTSNSNSLAASTEHSMYGNESDVSWPDNERVSLFRYLRPGSRCISLPPMVGLGGYSPIWSANAHSLVPNNDRVPNPLGSSSPAVSRNTNVKNSATVNRRGSPNRMADSGAGGDAGMAVFYPVNKEESSVNRTTPRGNKSALKSSGSKFASPKKRATIKIPGDAESEGLMSPKNEHSSLTNTSPLELDTPHNLSSHGTDHQDFFGGSDADDEEDDYDDIIHIDIDRDEEQDDVALSTIDLGESDAVNEERTQSELRQVEGRCQMSFQQIKEELLGCLSGMDGFKTFLRHTTGEDMLNFWLDCEMYRDNVKALGEMHANITRTRLFRDIQDKYKFKLTSDAMEQIKQAQGNTGLSESVFTRTQYDILRRLRSYWVARFILHQERMQDFSLEKIKEQQMSEFDDAKSPQLNFLPSISLVKSLPVRPSSCLRLATTSKDWSRVAMGGRRMQDTVQPGYLVDLGKMQYMPRPLSARFHVGLACDREAGRPFQQYLEKHHDRRLLANLLFWQDVTDYGIAEDRDADRLLRMSQAWSIFSRFIVDGGIWNIGLPIYEQDEIHVSLLLTSDFVKATTFQQAKQHAVHILQMEWLNYLKEDLRLFLECRARPEDRVFSGREASSVAAGKVQAEQIMKPKRSNIINTKARLKNATGDEDDSDDSEETESSDTDASYNVSALPPPPPPEELKIMTKKMLEKQRRKEETEKEAEEARKKAVKEKRKKQLALQRKICRQVKRERAARNKPQKSQLSFQTGQDLLLQQQQQNQGGQLRHTGAPGGMGETHGIAHLNIQDNRTEGQGDVTFKKMYKNKSVMSSFRNFMTETNNSKEGSHMLSMYLDIDMVLRIPDHQVERRIHQVKQLVNNYFDLNGKRHVSLQHDILIRLESEGDRVSTKTMEMAQKSVFLELERMFNQFWAAHVVNLEQQGAKVDLDVRPDSVQSIMLAYKKRHKGKLLNSGQQMPTNQDKTDFQNFLLSAAKGIPPPKLMHFHRHLIEYGDKDALPLLEKDLIFYLEAQRFKEAFFNQSEIALLKRKIEVITDCFLDSAVSLPPVQIDAPVEISSKVLKQASNFLQDKGKDPYSPNVFEDAQHAVFKEMVPYWASFTRRYDANEAKKHKTNSSKKLPPTRLQRLTRDRLRMFMEMGQPRKDFKLPTLSSAPQNRTGGTGISFSLSDGLQWKMYEYIDRLGSNEDSVATLNTVICSPNSIMDSALTCKLRTGLPRTNGETSSMTFFRHDVNPIKVHIT